MLRALAFDVIRILSFTICHMINICESMQKIAIYCPQGSGTLRQQLLSMHGIAWCCLVLHGIA